jgi:exonuclease SbcC
LIRRVRLENFQGHEDSELEFDSGLNVIIGTSNHGKSSLVRGIQWVWENRPRGDEFIRIGTDKSVVELENDAAIVIRERDRKSTGSYSLITEDIEDYFSVVGNDVPSPVLEVLNLSEINIQSQLDNHFLILDTAGKRAQFLNDITKLDKLSNAVTKLKSMKEKENSEHTHLQKELNNIQEYLDSGIIEFKEELVVLYNEASELDQQANTLRMEVNTLQRLLTQHKELEAIQIDENELDGIEDLLDEIEDLNVVCTNLKTEIQKVENLLNSRIAIKENLNTVLADIKSIEEEMKIVYAMLKECPNCGSVLTVKTREKLLNG